MLGEVHPVGARELLHAGGKPHGMTLRRIVHAQVVADGADHDLARVDSHAHREAEPLRALEFLGVASQLLTQV